MPKVEINRSIEEFIIIASAIIMTSTIVPFAIYRYINEQYLIASVELLGVAVMCSIGVYVWKTRKTEVMSVVTSIFMVSVVVLFNYLLSTSVLFWIYPVIMIVYFVNSLKVSFIIIVPTIIALLPVLLREKTTTEVVSILVTLGICQCFGYLLSTKIRQQYAMMEELINLDGLTGALNRRAFDERIQFLHDFSIRHKKAPDSVASLIILDIDNFKQINDDFGHQEGDQILINLTKVFKRNIRGIDQIYRYGGEEFVVIANGADALKAAELAEKLRLILETTSISSSTRVTASFGVAELQKLESPARWVDRADKAMYRAKRAGKNRVFIANFERKNREDETLLSAHG